MGNIITNRCKDIKGRVPYHEAFPTQAKMTEKAHAYLRKGGKPDGSFYKEQTQERERLRKSHVEKRTEERRSETREGMRRHFA